MNVRGSRMLEAPRAAVFEAIFDPATLLAVIPGCREIDRVDEAEYRGVISLRLPGLVGTYRTVVRVTETDPPAFGRLEGEIVGALGSIRGSASFRLAGDGPRTTVEYAGAGVIDGPLARLDSRFVESLAGSLINQALGNLEWRLQAVPSRSASEVTGA
jgi:carbon monoxide dehydrogenase subunit G